MGRPLPAVGPIVPSERVATFRGVWSWCVTRGAWVRCKGAGVWLWRVSEALGCVRSEAAGGGVTEGRSSVTELVAV